MTEHEIKTRVLEDVFNSCLNDSDYLYSLIEWAYRDYTDADFGVAFNEAGLGEI